MPANRLRHRRHAIDRTAAAMARHIARHFAPHKVILFGSRAAGTADPDSDVDLLVVMPLATSRSERELAIRRALRAWHVPKDVVVTTPEAFAWRRAVPGTVERSAARTGLILYEKR